MRDFLTGVEARTRNRRTREFYERGLLRILLPFCEAEGIAEAAQLDQRAVDRLAADLNARRKADGSPLAQASVASYLRAVRQFTRWAAGHKLLVQPVDVPRPRVPKPDLVADVLTRAEMERLAQACATHRDRVLVQLLCQTGLRLGEALALTADDLVDEGRQGKFVRVRHRSRGGGAKGDSTRSVPVRPALFSALHGVARSRPADALTDRLFVTNRRRPNGEYAPLAQRTVQIMLKVAAERAGIQKPVHPHLLRHSFATDFMRTRRDPVTLQRYLGHADLTMIANAYSHPSDSDLYQSMLDYLRADGD